MPRYPVVFYNVGPFGENGRRDNILRAELHAIASTGPKVIGLCETVGWGSLPNLVGYRKVRNRETAGRSNIAAYVRADLDFGDGDDVRWHDLNVTWARTEHPGQHDPRSLLELNIEGDQWLIGHHPPITRNNDTGPARDEHLDLLARRMAPWTRPDWDERTADDKANARKRLRVLLWDPNGAGQQLATRIGGWSEGSSIEGGVVRGGHFVKARKQGSVGGVRMGSDHHGAFLATVVDDR
jgi:hypothetical protein